VNILSTRRFTLCLCITFWTLNELPILCRWVPANYPLDLVAMWLHATEYSSSEWNFQCPPPPWSEPSWVPSEFEMH